MQNVVWPRCWRAGAASPNLPTTVSGFTITIHRGEDAWLSVGESGSGKSTIARTIAGLLPPRDGRIDFGGQDLASTVESRPAEMHRKIQIIFQNPDASLNPRHTVKQILDAPLRLYFEMDGKERLDRSGSLLEEVRLTPRYLERHPGQMSGGEKQRVAVARAFAAEPDLVLCDEVTSALDVSVQGAVLELLAGLQADRGAAYLFISHDLAVVRAIADRVAVLYQGRICEVGARRGHLRSALPSLHRDLAGGRAGAGAGRARATAREGRSGGGTASARLLFPATLPPPHRVHMR